MYIDKSSSILLIIRESPNTITFFILAHLFEQPIQIASVSTDVRCVEALRCIPVLWPSSNTFYSVVFFSSPAFSSNKSSPGKRWLNVERVHCLPRYGRENFSSITDNVFEYFVKTPISLRTSPNSFRHGKKRIDARGICK